MNRMTIRTKLSLLFVLLAVVPMAAVALVSYYNSIRSVEKVVEERSENLVAEVTADFDPLFSTLKSDVKLLARNRPVQDLYSNYGEDGRAAVEEARPAIGRFFRQFFEATGYTIVRLDYLDNAGGRLFRYARRAEANVIGESGYSFTMHDGPAVGGDRQSARPGEDLSVSNHFDSGSILRLSYPVRLRADGSTAGAVVADVEVNSLLEQKIGHPAFVGTGRKSAHGRGPGSPRIIIVSQEDQIVVFHHERSRAGKPLELVSPGLASLYENTISRGTGTASYTEGGAKRFASFSNHEQYGWTVVALSTPTQFTAPAERAGILNLSIALAAVLLALILVPLVIGRVTASIRRVTEGAEAIAAGDLDQQISVETHDETRTLADAFNRMAASLKSTLGELRQLTRELEDRVRRRTADLEEANRTVQEQNDQLLRERAADRLRNEVLSMKSSDDLRDVAGVFYRELNGLGIEARHCFMTFIDEERNRRENFMAIENPRRRGISWTSPDLIEIDEEIAVCRWDLRTDLHGTPFREEWLENWRARQPWIQPVVEGKEAPWERDMADFAERFGFETPPFTVDMITGHTLVPFEYGVTYISGIEWTDEQLAVVQELNEAVALGYLRFLDFQRVEAQNEALEEANRQIQEANRLKSEFLANMSHELRTPMNAIVGFTKIVHRRARGSLDDKQVDNLEKVLESSEILMNLINDILDLSKIEAGRLEIEHEQFSMRDLVNGCVSTISPLVNEGVTVKTEIDPSVDAVRSDQTRVRQILINLLSNAAKFTEHGTIAVALRSGADGRIELEVTDSGIGIPPAALDHIFDEFRQVDGTTTRKYGGTGLGLSISQKLAGMLGGDIRVASEEGKGSTFTVTLATQPPDEAALDDNADESAAVSGSPAAASTALSDDSKPRRIVLAIDDDPNVLSVITQELEEEGYQVVGASRAIEGIEKAKQLGPYAITLDIMMPGMDGWEAITRLKEDAHTRDIPLIVVSIIDNKDLGFRLGADDYLVKPIDKDALLAVLQKFHGRRREALVIDDDPVVIDLARQLLEEDGWTVRGAADGQQGLDEIARSRPDVVLLDLMMPVMDGFETLRRLRQDPETADLPVIVVTAKDLSGRELEDLRRNTARVIEKDGMDRDRILAELRESLKMVDTTAS